MTRLEWENIKDKEEPTLRGYVDKMLNVHLNNGYHISEFNIVVADPVRNEDGVPKKLAFSIVISTDEDADDALFDHQNEG